MLLAVDVGNTQTVFGLFRDGELGDTRRAGTEADRTGDELGVLLTGLIDLETVDGICLSSTVPSLVSAYEDFADRWVGVPIGSRTRSPRVSATARPASSSTSAPRRTSTSSPLRANTPAASLLRALRSRWMRFPRARLASSESTSQRRRP